MRTSLENIQKIDAYIAQELSATEMLVIKESIEQSPELNAIYQNQLLIQQAVNRQAILAQVQHFSGGGSSSFFSKFKWPIILSSLLLVVIGVLWATSNSGNPEKPMLLKNRKSQTTNAPVSVSNETQQADTISSDYHATVVREIMSDYPELANYKTVQSFISENKELPDGLRTWVKPEIQTFRINPQKSNTLAGKEGTLIIVPANAVLDENGNKAKGPVSIELIEALTIDKMIAYNLTTTQGEKMLSSGGMIYIQPIVDGKKGSFSEDTPCHIEIPTDDFNGEMSAWKGVVNSEGNIDWEQPKALENYLIPVDFSTLEFIPNGYRSHFQSLLPFENYTKSSKELEDSVYYSLTTCPVSGVSVVSSTNAAKSIEFGTSVGVLGQPKINSNAAQPVYKTTLKFDNLKKDAPVYVPITFMCEDKQYTFSPISANLWQLDFPADRDIVNGRILVKTNLCNSYVFENVTFTVNRLTELNFSKGTCQEAIVSASSNSTSAACFINPSSIKTIRQPKFANTFIATREFEERLQLLHKIKNSQPLLELYIENLGKNMYEVDQLVANKLTGKDKVIFQNFANQKLTNVKPNGANLKEIQEFYHATRLKFHQEAQANETKMNQKTLAELKKLDTELAQVQTEYFSSFHKNLPNGSMPTSNRKIPNLPKIKPTRPSVANNNTYKVSWYNSGWMNIDCYTNILSIGEKIVTINAKADSQNDRVYQCINSLKTVVGLTNQSGKYEGHYPSASNPEKINFNATYCVGISKNGDQISYASAIFNANEVNAVNLSYEPVSEEELLSRLKTLSPYNNRLAQAVVDEREEIRKAIEFKEKQTAILAERKKIADKKQRHDAFIQKLIEFIDPCCENGVKDENLIEPENPKIRMTETSPGYQIK